VKKKMLLIPLALLLVVSLIACATPAPAPTASTTVTATAPAATTTVTAPAPTTTAPAPTTTAPKLSYKWRMSSVIPTGDPGIALLEQFTEIVKENSNGRIVIDSFPGNLLGDWQSAYEETMRGTIELDVTCLSSVYDPRTGLVYTPYLATSWNDIKKLYAPGGFVYDTIGDILRVQGIELLSSYPSDFMGVGLRGDAPPSPKDPDVDKGLKIRVWADPAPEKIIEWFGYMPTVLPWSEVYTSVQMGVVDGVCTNLVSQYLWLADITDVWIYDRSLFEGWFFIMNAELFASSPLKIRISSGGLLLRYKLSELIWLKEKKRKTCRVSVTREPRSYFSPMRN